MTSVSSGTTTGAVSDTLRTVDRNAEDVIRFDIETPADVLCDVPGRSRGQTQHAFDVMFVCEARNLEILRTETRTPLHTGGECTVCEPHTGDVPEKYSGIRRQRAEKP